MFGGGEGRRILFQYFYLSTISFFTAKTVFEENTLFLGCTAATLTVAVADRLGLLSKETCL